MTPDWRPSRLHPDRVHLLAPNGRGHCGARIGASFARCALCVLLAEGVGAPTRIAVTIDHDGDPLPAHLTALASPFLDTDPLTARRAADALGPLGVLLTDAHLELENALRSIPEPSGSRRGGLVRYQLREAMVALEVTAAAYAQAEETLRFAS